MPASVEGHHRSGRTVKNVLMLSYHFYPFNHIATQRVAKMAKFLPKYGWNPLIVCPRWTRENCEFFDPNMVSAFEDSNVVGAIEYRCCLSGGLIRRMLSKCSVTMDPRILAVSALRYFARSLEKYPPELYYGVIRFLRRFLQTHHVDCIWATAPGPMAHAVAHWANRTFGIPWVADFRDIYDQKGLPEYERAKSYLRKIEPRIVSSSSAIVTVSEHLKKILQARYDSPVCIIPNGFDPSDYQESNAFIRQDWKVFSIAYTGKIIFPLRDPSPLFEALEVLISRRQIDSSKIRVCFYGTQADGTVEALLSRFPNLNGIVEVRARIPLAESVKIQKGACILLHLAHGGEKGIMTGKIFEYLGARRPILCIPGDHDCVDALLTQTNAGAICHNTEETAAQLLRWYKEWQNTGSVSYQGREEEIMKYSRQEQARQLARLLDESIVDPKEPK